MRQQVQQSPSEKYRDKAKASGDAALYCYIDKQAQGDLANLMGHYTCNKRTAIERALRVAAQAVNLNDAIQQNDGLE